MELTQSSRYVRAMRYIALVAGCLGVGVSYVINAFLVFALAVKAIFALSQTELLLLLSVMFLGLCASLPGGIVLDKFGARWASFLSLVVSVSGYVMCWSACADPAYYSQHFYLLVFYFLVAGIGGGLTYMIATASNVRNFSDQSRGTVVGILHAALSAGPAVLIMVYENFYMEDIDPNKQDVQGFFLFLTISFGAVNLLGILVYDYYPPDDPEKFPLVADAYDQSGSVVSGDSTVCSMESQKSKKEIERSVKLERSRQHAEITGSCNVLKFPAEEPEKPSLMVFVTLDFQMMLWPFIILTALQMMFVQNLTIVLESFHQEAYSIVFPFLTPILGTVAKPLIGIVSDLSVQQIPRTVYIIVGSLISVFVWLLSAFLIEQISVIVIATTLCDIAAYFVYSLGPALVIERFGLASFARNWGLIMGGFSIMTAGLLSIFGAVYDGHSGASHTCFGTSCFYATFLVSTGVSILALICSIVYHIRRSQRLAIEPLRSTPKLSGMTEDSFSGSHEQNVSV